MKRRCCSTPGRARCFRWCARRWRVCCPWNGCATSASRTSSRTSAEPARDPGGRSRARPWRHRRGDGRRTPRRRRAHRSPTARCCRPAGAPSAGTMRRTCRTGGNAGYLFETSTADLSSVETYSPRGARSTSHSPRRTSSRRARRSAGRWTTYSHTRERRGEARETRAASRPRTLACMHGSTWRGDRRQASTCACRCAGGIIRRVYSMNFCEERNDQR